VKSPLPKRLGLPSGFRLKLRTESPKETSMNPAPNWCWIHPHLKKVGLSGTGVKSFQFELIAFV